MEVIWDIRKPEANRTMRLEGKEQDLMIALNIVSPHELIVYSLANVMNRTKEVWIATAKFAA